MDGFEVIRDEKMDKMFEEIIEIFKLEGVELVRLSGLTNWCKKASGKHDIPDVAIDSIIKKMNSHNVINYHHTLNCPNCNETSYVIKHEEDFKQKPKLCDTCNIFYTLIEGSTLNKI